MIKPILYERIEQKKEIERELFSKLTPKEQRALKKTWLDFLSFVSEKESKRRS